MKKTQGIYAMTIVVGLVFLTSIVKGQEQPITIGVGLNKSHANGSGLSIMDEASYYVQVASIGRLNDYMAYGADIQFTQHRNKFDVADETVTFNAHTVDISFYYKLYPTKERFNIIAGFQAGFTTLAKIEDSNIDTDQGHFGVLAGGGYEFGKYAINFRAIRYIQDAKLFDNVMQIGVAYSIGQ